MTDDYSVTWNDIKSRVEKWLKETPSCDSIYQITKEEENHDAEMHDSENDIRNDNTEHGISVF